MTGLWQENVDKIQTLLSKVSFRDKNCRELGADVGFSSWKELSCEVRNSGRTIYLIGNGASASMAGHFAADLAKNARIHAQVFFDISLITALANDISYEEIFSEPLRWKGKKGDMLVAISSSGKSPNVLNAAETAQRLNLNVVTLSAMSPENPLRNLGDINVYVSAETYGLAETCHTALLHRWMASVEIY